MDTNVYEEPTATSKVVGVIPKDNYIEANQVKEDYTDPKYEGYPYEYALFNNWYYFKNSECEGWIYYSDYRDHIKNTLALKNENKFVVGKNTSVYSDPSTKELTEDTFNKDEIYTSSYEYYGSNDSLSGNIIYLGVYKSGKLLWVNAQDVATKSKEERYKYYYLNLHSYDDLVIYTKINDESSALKTIRFPNEKFYLVEYTYTNGNDDIYWRGFEYNNKIYWIKADTDTENGYILFCQSEFEDIELKEMNYYSNFGLIVSGVLKAGTYRGVYITYNELGNIYYIKGYGYVLIKKDDPNFYINYSKMDLYFSEEVKYYSNPDCDENDIIGTFEKNKKYESVEYTFISGYDENHFYYIKDYGYINISEEIETYEYKNKTQDKSDTDKVIKSDNKKVNKREFAIYLVGGTVILSLATIVTIVLINKKRKNKKMKENLDNLNTINNDVENKEVINKE